MNGWRVETLDDGSIVVHWPSGHTEGPYSPEEWAEMERGAD